MARPDETKRKEDEAREHGRSDRDDVPFDEEDDDGEGLELPGEDDDEEKKPEEKRAPGRSGSGQGRRGGGQPSGGERRPTRQAPGRSAERDRQAPQQDKSKEPGRR
jgi:hypothetical protein